MGMKYYKPRLTADEEPVVQEGLRLLLFATQEALKRTQEWSHRAGLRQKVDNILATARSLGLDVDWEGDEEEESNGQTSSPEV